VGSIHNFSEKIEKEIKRRTRLLGYKENAKIQHPKDGVRQTKFLGIATILGQTVKKGKKYLIRVETHSVEVHRPLGREATLFCSGCGEVVEMISFDAAVARSGVSGLRMIELIRSDQVHAVETHSGSLLICTRTLESISMAGTGTNLEISIVGG
jgi:hypothetical protein